MRSLNRSLPTEERPAPPEQLLEAFKQAARSVAHLYKAASNDHDSIRQAGYQEAIDDLLKFMDRENLGVQDGEGWAVRQWATAKFDGTFHSSDNEEEQQEQSPEIQSETVEQTRSKSEPARDIPPSQQQQQQPTFQFSAGDSMQTEEPTTDSSPIRIEVVNRQNRSSHRHNNRLTRTSSRLEGQSSGSKRKLPFPDLSDIFDMNFDKKDGFDGGNGGGSNKRSRVV